MCKECGCEDKAAKGPQQNGSDEKNVQIDRKVTEANDATANKIAHELIHKEILCINLLGSPGSGKTTLIEGIAQNIPAKIIGVIQGDLESDVDKKRLEQMNIEAYQINTHSGCHLNAEMIKEALGSMNLDNKRFLIVENVGNLVCPAGVKIGQHINIVVSSTTEGSDKPKKYPYIFMDADLILISKYDLKDAVGFDEQSYLSDISRINPQARIIKCSNRKSSCFQEVAHFLEHEREHVLGHHHH
ncbi:hydrogenase nickel incorporation protein HypB [Candidatus Woesearchaeota archaeon]|nr:hydrogenase nickel incorporation protein HypB [Candidatus Woesearchaeota archaeon]